jgi:hypothetical protein
MFEDARTRGGASGDEAATTQDCKVYTSDRYISVTRWRWGVVSTQPQLVAEPPLDGSAPAVFSDKSTNRNVDHV